MLWYKVLFILDKTTKTTTHWRLSTVQSSWKSKLDQTTEKYFIFFQNYLSLQCQPARETRREISKRAGALLKLEIILPHAPPNRTEKKQRDLTHWVRDSWLAHWKSGSYLPSVVLIPKTKQGNVNLLYPALPTILKTPFHFTHDSFSLKCLLNIFLKTL